MIVTFKEHAIAAVRLSDGGAPHRGKRWLAIWVADHFGPVIMAAFTMKQLEFGITTESGKFKWIQWEW